MIIIFTGNGKGKTSAALGIALRSLGWERSICIIQFIKGNKEVGEWKFLNEIVKLLNYQIVIKQFGDDKKLSITEKGILDNPEYKKSCEEAWRFTKEMILSKKYDLVILDEINNALNYKLLNENEVLSFVGANCCSPNDSDIIFTGRDASQSLIDLADMVTEMIETKHPFQKDISAKKGIDY